MQITKNKIIERCGEVSFRRGEAFCRSKQVTMNTTDGGCEAIVSGIEDFHVRIEADGSASCTCPVLASVSYDCQHVAAVLIAMMEQQQSRSRLLDIFQPQTRRPSSRQSRFENREVLAVRITCQAVEAAGDENRIGIEFDVAGKPVDVLPFLQLFHEEKSGAVRADFIYSPLLHCFEPETDAALQELAALTRDSGGVSGVRLLVPPHAWPQLMPLLAKAPDVYVRHGGRLFAGLLPGERLSLEFNLLEADKGFELLAEGMDRMTIFTAHETAWFGREVFQLASEEIQQLAQLKEMFDQEGADRVTISSGELGDLVEKVLPALRNFGEVQVAPSVAEQFMETPLVAKLFLDRVKDRLLAGLEFHYGHVVINPVEEAAAEGLVFRQVEKETKILKLMEESLFTETESGYFLHNEELEYDFLTYRLPELEKLVRVYATGAVRGRVLIGPSRPKLRIRMKKERTDWLEFKFEMDGIYQADIKELLAHLEEKRKYYRMRSGSLLSLETREFKKVAHFLSGLDVQAAELAEGFEVPIVQGIRLMSGEEDEDLFSTEASFRKFLDELQDPSRLDFPMPQSLSGVLRSYQADGFRWMKQLAAYGFGGVLADDMGLGKTVQSIAFIVSELENIRERGVPALIVCPSAVMYNWLQELKTFAPEVKALVMDGTQQKRMNKQKQIEGLDVLIVSYPLLVRDSKWYEKQSFHAVFYDEAQAFKNPTTQTAKAAKKIQAAHRFALTGTPIENALEELWSIYYVVFPELFGSVKDYSNLLRKQVKRRVRPFLLRRMKKDVLAELPGKQETLERVDLLPEQKQLYAAYLAKLRHDTFKHLDKDTVRRNRIRILAGITRLRQICCHPALFVDDYEGGSAKLEQLLEIVKEAERAGRRMLIFSQFTQMLDMIGRELAKQGRQFFYLDGSTPSEERLNLCSRFNEGERDLFLISLKAGGTGLNLTGADTVVLYDTWWNPAVEAQAADRAHRMGQTNTVQVIKLIAKGTIEEKMNELQEKKRDLIGDVIDSSAENEAWGLTEEEIQEMLGQEAE